ncbi:MAG: DUF1207 domain-containing protein [bacterium]|nr:DUF1207 domain-containing protein [bacterium]
MNRKLLKYLVLIILIIGAGFKPALLFVYSAELGGNIEENISSSEFDYHLRGYIEAWLFYKYSIDTDRLKVKVKNGVVTLEGGVYSDKEKRVIPLTIRSFKGVTDVVTRLQIWPSLDNRYKTKWQSWAAWPVPNTGERKLLFPKGDIFAPPFADPKQPKFFASVQRYKTEFITNDFLAVGFGEEIGLVRWPGEFEGDGKQLGISGAVLAIFNLEAKSKDLINADYIIGFPLSVRKGVWSGRARIYHQSSHLGDEFLLFPQPGPKVERINLSFEAMEFLGSWEKGRLRLYGGGNRILQTDTPLDKNRLQSGMEYRFTPAGWEKASLISGIDLNGILKNSYWAPALSIKAGLMFHSPYDDIRSLQLFLEYYKGRSPYGQFSENKVSYYGMGFAFSI